MDRYFIKSVMNYYIPVSAETYSLFINSALRRKGVVMKLNPFERITQIVENGVIIAYMIWEVM